MAVRIANLSDPSLLWVSMSMSMSMVPVAAVGLVLVLQGGMYGEVLMLEAPRARARPAAAAIQPVPERATRSWAA